GLELGEGGKQRARGKADLDAGRKAAQGVRLLAGVEVAEAVDDERREAGAARGGGKRAAREGGDEDCRGRHSSHRQESGQHGQAVSSRASVKAWRKSSTSGSFELSIFLKSCDSVLYLISPMARGPTPKAWLSGSWAPSMNSSMPSTPGGGTALTSATTSRFL